MSQKVEEKARSVSPQRELDHLQVGGCTVGGVGLLNFWSTSLAPRRPEA